MKKQPTTTPRATRIVSLLAALAVILAGLLTVAATAAPASAATSSKPGYADVTDIYSYLQDYESSGIQVDYVDFDHETPDGFWFAVDTKTGGIRDSQATRGFEWLYQPFGMWCGGSAQKVAMDAWSHTYRCGADPSKAPQAFETNTAACIRSTGEPWMYGSSQAGGVGCTDGTFIPTDEPLNGSPTPSYCAPWETGNACSQEPSWYANRASFWSNLWFPEPDPCTGLPADFFKGSYDLSTDPTDFVPAHEDGTCTGLPVAANCPLNTDGTVDTTQPGGTSEACGAAPLTPDAFASSTQTVTQSATVSESVAVHKTAKAKRYTAHARYRYHGHTYKASYVLYKTGSATVSRSSSASASRSATETATCHDADQAAAQSCADALATSEASSAALSAATTAATSAAKSRAKTAATTAATHNARLAAKKKHLTAHSRKVAKHRALVAAKKKAHKHR